MNRDESRLTALSMRERISYGFGGMGNAIVLAVVSTFLMFFYTDIIGLNVGIIGALMLVSRVFDGISDLVMGYIVDRTNSKYGKARCWLLWLCVPYAAAGVLLFLLQGSWSETVQYVYVFITYNLVNTVFYTGVCVPYNAMNCLVTRDQYERGVLGTTNVMGNVAGQILVNTFMLKLVSVFGDNQTAWIIGAAAFGVVGIVSHMICFTQTVERNAVEQAMEKEPGFLLSVRSLFHNKYWLIVTAIATTQFFMAGVGMSINMYFASAVLHDEQKVAGIANSLNIAQIIIFFCAFAIIRKLGKGGCYRLGFVISVVSFLLQIPAGDNYILLIACGAIRRIGIGMASACLGGMISDTIEYGEWKTSVHCVGVGNAANTFSQKVGMGVGTAAVGWILSAAGYQGSAAQQTASAIRAIHGCYTYIPMVCCIIIVILACFYHLDKQYPQIMKELETRREQRAKD